MESSRWVRLPCTVNGKEMEVSISFSEISYFRQWKSNGKFDFNASSITMRNERKLLKVLLTLDEIKMKIPYLVPFDLSESMERVLVNADTITHYRPFINDRNEEELFIIYFPSFHDENDCYFIVKQDPSEHF